jgi:hypothetical protein
MIWRIWRHCTLGDGIAKPKLSPATKINIIRVSKESSIAFGNEMHFLSCGGKYFWCHSQNIQHRDVLLLPRGGNNTIHLKICPYTIDTFLIGQFRLSLSISILTHNLIGHRTSKKATSNDTLCTFNKKYEVEDKQMAVDTYLKHGIYWRKSNRILLFVLLVSCRPNPSL